MASRSGAAAPARAADGAVLVHGQRITHPERVLYPEDGFTKLDLARYYEAVGPAMIRHVAGRPLTLVRCPEGLGSCFFMKHSSVWSPPALRTVPIQEKTKVGQYLVADDVAGLIALCQMSVLEIHTWNSTAGDVDRYDRIVLDLDPGPEVPWREVVEAARLLRASLDSLHLTSFVKTTGGKGLHVVVPLAPAVDWEVGLAFSRAFAELVVRHRPQRYTTAMAKAGREKKILIDYLRNNRTNTSVAAFSTRARPGAPVSTPLSWDELGPRLRAERFTVESVPRRLASQRVDPWARSFTIRQTLDPALARRLEDELRRRPAGRAVNGPR